MSYYVYITQVDNCFVADVPALPGCRTFGRSEAEVLENIRDVVRGYLQSLRKRNRTAPRVKVVKLSDHLPFSRGAASGRSVLNVASKNGIAVPPV